ncbi:MAG: hypothetical protein Q8P99_00205, partial [bacterium]|nr:hypothetical protein [bacterium]
MLKFSQQPIEERLLSLQRDAEERDAMRRAKEEGLPYLNLGQQPIDRSAVEIVSEALAKEGQVVVFARDKNKVQLG